MRKTFFVIVGAVLLSVPIAMAQDIVKVAPKNTKVLLDNDRVRVVEVWLKAGDKIPMHSHPGQILYSFLNGKTKTSFPDGKSAETEFKAGEARWSDAVVHANEATTDGHVLVIELKEPVKTEKK